MHVTKFKKDVTIMQWCFIYDIHCEITEVNDKAFKNDRW